MKNKDNILIFIFAIVLLVFVSYFISYSFKMKKVNLIREDLVNDSIIFEQNNNLQFKDSVILKNNDVLKRTIILHEKRIQSLEKVKHFHPVDTSKL
jgi:hypothetical protein